MAFGEEGRLTVDRLTDLFSALTDAVKESGTLLLLSRSPPDATRSPSITVGAEKGGEKPRLLVTFEPASEQVVFQGVYWRSGKLTPDMREQHGLLFPPADFRLDEDGYGFSDPRPGVALGHDEGLVWLRPAREAAGFLLELLEHFYGIVEERSD